MVITGTRPICPNCGCKSVYHRLITKTFRCHQCGHVWPAESEKAIGG